ncbi:MAG: cytochrome C oxidase subunit IV family protein [Terriglobales bacterium]
MSEAKAHEGHGTAQYYWVWGGLLALTAIEIVLAYKQAFPPLQMLLILLVLSIIKAGLIIAYFMHLKFEAGTMKVTLMTALVVCLCLMFVFIPDAMRVLELGVK